MSRLCTSALLTAALFTAAPLAYAEPEKYVQLEYERHPGAELCPSKDLVELLVANEFLHYDPITTDPYETRRLVLEASKRDGQLVAEAAVYEGDTLLWKRGPFAGPATSCECRERIAELALALSIWLDPPGLKQGESAAPIAPPAPSAPPSAPCRAAPSEVPTKQEKITVERSRPGTHGLALGGVLPELSTRTFNPGSTAGYAEYDPSRPWSASITGGGFFWEPGTIAPTFALGAGYRWQAFSGNVEARVAIPIDAGGFKPGTVGISLLPCVHWRVLFGCVRGSAGLGWITYVYGTFHTLLLGVGGRVGLDLPITEYLSVMATFDMVGSNGIQRNLDDKPRRVPSIVYGYAGLGIAAHF
uniref:Outer membrane protein beta-barrel domain-containing protein n=1 Tax=Racemicystis crocea TaxID=1707966 RepID=A0A3S7V0J1_9BACT|nr:hypothetical protein [Racemicystis crocea]